MTNPKSVLDHHFDLSLRLWSDRIPLGDLIDRLQMKTRVLHILNMPMASEGPLSERRARRHFASAAEQVATNDREVNEWVRSLIGTIVKDRTLREQLATGQIEAVLWIAILGGAFTSNPTIETPLVAAAKALKVDVLIENYTSDAAELPEKTWLAYRSSESLAQVG